MRFGVVVVAVVVVWRLIDIELQVVFLPSCVLPIKAF